MPVGSGRSLSEVQETAQLLSGESLPQIVLGALLQKSGVAPKSIVTIVNLTPYDGWLEKTCHQGFADMTFKCMSVTKNLTVAQYVEKTLALDLMEDC